MVSSGFLCESILGEVQKYFIRLEFEVLKALKQLIVRKNLF